MGINELITTYLKTNDEKIFNEIISLIRKGEVSKIKANINKDFLLKKVDGKTLLELLIENNKNIEFDWITGSIIKNDQNLLKICFDNDKYDILDYPGESVLVKDYFGEPLFEYLLKNDKVTPNMIDSFYTNPIVIQLCKKYHKEEMLSNLSNGKLLFEKFDDNRTVIEYLFDSNLVNKSNIRNVESPEIFDLIVKYNRLEFLDFINEKALEKNHNGKMLIDELLERGVVPSSIYDNVRVIKRVIECGRLESLKDKFTTTLFLEIDEDGKRLIDYLIEKDIIPDNIINEVQYYTRNSENIARILCEKDRYDLLQNACEELLLKNINGENILFEDLLLNGYTPDPYKCYSNPEILPILIKYNMFESLGKCSESLFFTKLPNGKRVIDEIVDRNIPLSGLVVINNKDVLDIFIQGNRYDLLSNADIKLLLKHYDLNDTYLDIALKNVKTDEEIVSFDINTKDLVTMAKKYIIFAKYNYHMYLSTLDKEDLLEKENGKRLIDILLEIDSKTTIDKIISPKIKEDFEIAMAIRLNGFEQKNIIFDSVTRDFNYEYLKRNNERYDKSKLTPEKLAMIDELRRILDDGKSDSVVIDTLISSYTYLLLTDSKYANEIFQIVNLKNATPDFNFKHIESGAYYLHYKKSVCVDDENIDTLNHETGHALFHNLTDEEYPKEFEEAITRRKNSPEFLKRVEEYSNMFHLIADEISSRVERTYMKEYDKSITEEKIKEIEKFILEEKNKHRQEYIKSGIPSSVVDKILNETYTVSEYLEQDRRNKKNKLIDLIMRIEYGPFIAIGDFIDGIVDGKFRDDILLSDKGSKIKHAYGHGVNYYIQGNIWAFDEMIANYSEIIKSESPDEGIKALRYFIGDEIMDIIINYYDTKILGSKKYTETQEKAL